MKALLSRVFEDHLFKVEDTTEVATDVFIENVVSDYLGKVSKDGYQIPWMMKGEFEEELREEVLEMVRIKTYGCFSIADFRKKNADVIKRRRSY